MATKPRRFADTQIDILEGIEEELLQAEKALRAGVVENAGNPVAIEALMHVAEPIARSSRALTAALSGDLQRARDIVEKRK